MKCPKCGYLGFETTERCRYCGYDFSLSVHLDAEPIHTLPLRDSNEIEAPLADFDLSGLNTGTVTDRVAGLDLDQIIGQTDPMPFSPTTAHGEGRRVEAATAIATPSAEDIQQQYQVRVVAAAPLPLFTDARTISGESPAIAPPPAARPPLAVRRATPEVPRRRTPRNSRPEFADLELQLEPTTSAGAHAMDRETEPSERLSASAVRRIAAAIVDLAILGSINAAVAYLTIAIAGLSMSDWRIVPPVPIAAFLMLLNGGYLIGFTFVRGQTIGKMLTKVRVIGGHGESVDIAGAVLRALGAMLSVLLLGLPYLPVLISNDRRALHDRLAGTRVIKDA